jgi:hypothetical protein
LSIYPHEVIYFFFLKLNRVILPVAGLLEERYLFFELSYPDLEREHFHLDCFVLWKQALPVLVSTPSLVRIQRVLFVILLPTSFAFEAGLIHSSSVVFVFKVSIGGTLNIPGLNIGISCGIFKSLLI